MAASSACFLLHQYQDTCAWHSSFSKVLLSCGHMIILDHILLLLARHSLVEASRILACTLVSRGNAVRTAPSVLEA